MKTAAFIPARGGSKRLKGKNILAFGGRPLIWYSVAFARYHRMDRIIVSTDDEAIAASAVAAGAEVLMRPSELATDTASTAAAAFHCLETLHQEGFEPDVFITLQPTNPLRPEDLFRKAMDKYETGDCDSVIAVGKNKYKFGSLVNDLFTPMNYAPGTRSQDLGDLFYENGLLYLTRPSVLLSKEIFGKKIKTVETGELYSGFDIDTALDFEIAEHVYKTHSSEFNYLK